MTLSTVIAEVAVIFLSKVSMRLIMSLLFAGSHDSLSLIAGILVGPKLQEDIGWRIKLVNCNNKHTSHL